MGRRQVTAFVVLGLLQVVVLVSLALAGPDDATHRAPIRVVAPAVVAASVVDTANAAAGRPVDASALATGAEARASVRSGRSVAAVVVDLSQERDHLYVASANGVELNRVIVRQVREVEAAFGRSVVVRDLVPARSGDAGHRWVYGFTALSVLVGLAVAVVITWLRGPRTATLAGGVRRLAVLAGVAATVGVLVGGLAAGRYGTGFGAWWLLVTLTVLAASTSTFALESLFGVVGIGVATTILVLAAAPLVSLTHPLLLPEPWASITPWLPHGAALAGGTSQAYFGGDQLLRPLLVLSAWTALSLLTTVVARRERRWQLTTADGSLPVR